MNHSSGRLESPMLFNLLRDPKEETNVAATNTWCLQPMLRLKQRFFSEEGPVAKVEKVMGDGLGPVRRRE